MATDKDDITGKSEAEFNSRDITKRPTTEYFVKTRQKFGPRLILERIDKVPLLRGWRKFVALALVVIVIVAPITIICIANQPQSTEPAPEVPATRTASEIYQQAVEASLTGKDSAYFDALAVFDDAIAEATNEEVKTEIKIMKATFLSMNGAYLDAIALLLELKDSEAITSGQKGKVMIMLINLYHDHGYTADAEALAAEYEELYPGGRED
jgi:outer membrane protein assembly factor BamD (BamD/ComL family)